MVCEQVGARKRNSLLLSCPIYGVRAWGPGPRRFPLVLAYAWIRQNCWIYPLICITGMDWITAGVSFSLPDLMLQLHCWGVRPLQSIAQRKAHCTWSAGPHAVHTCPSKPINWISILSSIPAAHCACKRISAVYNAARYVDYGTEGGAMWISFWVIGRAQFSR